MVAVRPELTQDLYWLTDATVGDGQNLLQNVSTKSP